MIENKSLVESSWLSLVITFTIMKLLSYPTLFMPQMFRCSMPKVRGWIPSVGINKSECCSNISQTICWVEKFLYLLLPQQRISHKNWKNGPVALFDSMMVLDGNGTNIPYSIRIGRMVPAELSSSLLGGGQRVRGEVLALSDTGLMCGHNRWCVEWKEDIISHCRLLFLLNIFLLPPLCRTDSLPQTQRPRTLICWIKWYASWPWRPPLLPILMMPFMIRCKTCREPRTSILHSTNFLVTSKSGIASPRTW